jgi:hypothetical protein
MAARMACIALRRPDPAAAQAHVRRARNGLRARAAEGEAHLLNAIATASARVMIDLHDVSAETAPGAWRLQAWLGVVRVVAERRPVLLVLPQSVRLRIARLLPPGVRAIAAGEVPACLARWPNCRRILASVSILPPLHPNLLWEAAALRLREMWAETADGRAALAVPLRLLILREHGPDLRFGGGTPVATLDTTDPEAVARALLRLLIAPGAAGIVCAAAAEPVRLAFLDVCALRGLAFHGVVDAAALLAGALPEAAARELAHRAAEAARTMTNPTQKEPLCLAA